MSFDPKCFPPQRFSTSCDQFKDKLIVKLLNKEINYEFLRTKCSQPLEITLELLSLEMQLNRSLFWIPHIRVLRIRLIRPSEYDNQYNISQNEIENVISQ